MKKKLAALIIAFSVFSFSVPQNAVAGVLHSVYAKSDINAVSSPMKLINMLDISMKMAKVCYDAGKEFLSGFCFLDSGNAVAGFFDGCKNVFIFVSKDILALRQFKNARVYGNEPRGAAASYEPVFVPDKYRLRRTKIIDVCLLYIEALRKGSLPASVNSIMKFYSPALGIFPEAGFIFWSAK